MNMNENTNVKAEELNNNAALVAEIEDIASQMLQIKVELQGSSSVTLQNKLAQLQNLITAKIIELKNLKKYYNGSTAEVAPIDNVSLWSVICYDLNNFGRTGKLVRDAKNPNKEYYEFSDEDDAEVIPFMYYFNVAYAKKVRNPRVDGPELENLKAKVAAVKSEMRKTAKNKGLKLGRISFSVLNKNAVEKFLLANKFTAAEIASVVALMDKNLVCSNEAGNGDEECTNSVGDAVAYNRFGAEQGLDNQWLALFDAQAEAKANKDQTVKSYIQFLATYNLCREAREDASVVSCAEKLVDKDFLKCLLAEPVRFNEMRLEDAIIAFYASTSEKRINKRETVQKQISATRKLIANVLRHGTAKRPVEASR